MTEFPSLNYGVRGTLSYTRKELIMKVKLEKGIYTAHKGTTTIYFVNGNDRLRTPIKMRTDLSDHWYEARDTDLDLIQLIKGIEQLYTEEQLLEFIFKTFRI